MSESIDQVKKIFISFSHDDIVTARFIHHYLKTQNWRGVDIFFSDVSIPVTADSWNECKIKCGEADLGLIILSKSSLRSPNVKTERKILRKKLFIEINRDAYKGLGSDKYNQTFPLYDYRYDIYEGMKIIALEIEKQLSIKPCSAKKVERREFEKIYFPGSNINHLPRRDACALLKSMKCAEKEIRIMGENSLQPIHGGFEDLKNFLNEGGTVKVIINDYDSEEYARREKIEGAETTKRIRADWIATIGNLKQLDQIKEKGRLEVKVTGEELNASIVIIDDWELQYNKYNRRRTSTGKREFGSGVTLLLNREDTKPEYGKMIYLNREDTKLEFEDHTKEFDNMWNDERSKKVELNGLDLNRVVPVKFFKEASIIIVAS